MTGPFANFRRVMSGPSAPSEVAEIATLLAHDARRACLEFGLIRAEIDHGGGYVTFFLTDRDVWEAVVVGPGAYRLYPGFVNAGRNEITWPNIWVAADYDLDKFTRELEYAFRSAARESDAQY